MKKFRTYILVTGSIIIIITAVLLVKRYGGYAVKSDYFAIKDIERVSTIALETKGEKVVLKKVQAGWTVNDNSGVRQEAINILLETLSRLSIKSTVTESLFQEDWNVDSKLMIRITLRENPGGLRSFLVYPVNSNPYGNYFKKREGGTAYIVNIPGYGGNVGSLFITNEKYWLPHLVYKYQPSEIREVSMLVHNSENQSFKILQDSTGSVRFQSLPADNPIENLDSSRVLRYLSYFSSLRFERWVFDQDSIDMNEVFASQPLFELSIKDNSGSVLNLKIYPIISETEDNKKEIDLNRIYGRMNNELELVVIKYVDIDPVLKVRSNFIEKPDE